MKSFDTSLLVLESTSLTSGLVAHEAIATAAKDVRILEATVVGEDRYLVLATGTFASLEAALEAVHAKLDPESSLVDQELIEKPSQSLFESALSLIQQRLEESLVVVETETCSGCFALVQRLIDDHGMKPIELRIRRSGKGAHAFLTGPAKGIGPAIVDARSRLKNASRKGHVEGFEDPSQALKSQFDFV